MPVFPFFCLHCEAFLCFVLLVNYFTSRLMTGHFSFSLIESVIRVSRYPFILNSWSILVCYRIIRFSFHHYFNIHNVLTGPKNPSLQLPQAKWLPFFPNFVLKIPYSNKNWCAHGWVTGQRYWLLIVQIIRMPLTAMGDQIALDNAGRGTWVLKFSTIEPVKCHMTFTVSVHLNSYPANTESD